MNNSVRKYFFACVLITGLIVAGCSQKSMQGAGQGAAIGGAAGAVGGIVSTLVFGGDVGEAAARGAVWAASSGAVTGGIAGAQADKAEKEQQKAAREARLKKELGDDAYNGLVALAECKYEVALGYARSSAQSSNIDYALAGLWLEILTEADRGQLDQARALFPELIEKDPKVQSAEDGEKFMTEAKGKLEEVRSDHKLKGNCSA
mgnify:CR=1 FL=1